MCIKLIREKKKPAVVLAQLPYFFGRCNYIIVNLITAPDGKLASFFYSFVRLIGQEQDGLPSRVVII
jgi:hypothetical protein